MNMYEFTFLVDDSKALKTLETALNSFDGKKINEKAWGKKLLAFPINKNTSAEYYTWQIEMEPAKLKEFKTKLNYENIVMRYLLLNADHIAKVSKKKKEVKKLEE